MVEVLIEAWASLDKQSNVGVVYRMESEYVSCLLVDVDALTYQIASTWGWIHRRLVFLVGWRHSLNICCCWRSPICGGDPCECGGESRYSK